MKRKILIAALGIIILLTLIPSSTQIIPFRKDNFYFEIMRVVRMSGELSSVPATLRPWIKKIREAIYSWPTIEELAAHGEDGTILVEEGKKIYKQYFSSLTDKLTEVAERLKQLYAPQERLALKMSGKKLTTSEIEDLIYNDLQIAKWYLPVVQVFSANIRGDIKVVVAVPQDSIVTPATVNMFDYRLGMFSPEVTWDIVNEMAITPNGYSLHDLKRLFEDHWRP